MASFIRLVLLTPLIDNTLSVLQSPEEAEALGSAFGIERELRSLEETLRLVVQKQLLSFSELVNPRDLFSDEAPRLYRPLNSAVWDFIATVNEAADILDDLSLELHLPRADSGRRHRFFSKKNRFVFTLLARPRIGAVVGRLMSHLLLIRHNPAAPVVSWEDNHAKGRHCLGVSEDSDEMAILEFLVGGGSDSEPPRRRPQLFPLNQKQLRKSCSSYYIGRDEDEKEILRLLLSASAGDRLSVLQIVGIAGVGKTSLADAVFWNEEVKSEFRHRLWVWVDDDFRPHLITDLISSVASELKWRSDNNSEIRPPCCRLGDAGRYLLVLDGLNSLDQVAWLDFTKQLEGTGSADGSCILITARDNLGVATVPPHPLKGLSGFLSSQLLHTKAGSVPQHLKETGNQLIYHSAGVPLAVQSSRYSLYSSLWQDHGYPVQYNYADIFERLRQSFDRLHSHLKHAFAICSLFPMNVEINRSLLIKLWMAAEVVRDQEVGDEYFQQLRGRSFFDEVEEDEFGCVKDFKLHKLMHDFAKSIANLHQYYVYFDGSPDQFSNLLREKRFRGCRMLLFSRRSDFDDSVSDLIFGGLVEDLSSLRVLDFHDKCLKAAPSNIDRLRQLRYLDLSENPSLEMLPNSITNLWNLQTLKLSYCVKLRKLPEDIAKLANLRHLEIDGCWALTHLPRGIEELTSLQTLSMFTLGVATGITSSRKKKPGQVADLSALRKLNQLRGCLELRHLERVTDASSEVKAAKLEEKSYLETLTLSWGRQEGEGSPAKDERTLADLEPHSGLKGLCIIGFSGESFRSWPSSAQNLVKLTLTDCSRCQHLQQLDQFQRLKYLTLENLGALKYVAVSGSDSANIFPQLMRLRLRKLAIFRGWIIQNDVGQEQMQPLLVPFPKLSEVTINDCPELTFMPLSPKLESLHFNKIRKDRLEFLWKLLFPSIFDLRDEEPGLSSSHSSSTSGTQLKSLSMSCVWDLDNLSGLHLNKLTSLHDLEIRQCPILKSLPCYTSLRSLTIFGCHRLTSLSGWISGFHALEKLKLKWCPELNLLDYYSTQELDLRLWPEFNLPPTVDTSDDSSSKNEGSNLWGTLSSLIYLEIVGIPRLISLPEGIQSLTTLQHLELSSCEGLTALPEWIVKLRSLRRVSLNFCPKLKSVPEGLIHLPDLYEMKIVACPLLNNGVERKPKHFDKSH